MMNAFIMRVNMSVAIVAMVEAPEVDVSDVHECRYLDAGRTDKGYEDTDNTTEEAVVQKKTFSWDAKTRGWILSGFYYGYITTPLLGGWLEHKFGGKIVFGSAVFLSSIVTLAMPALAYVSPQALLASRVLLGIVQGPVYPSHHGMWGKWAPPVERSKLMSIAMTGPYVGVALSYIISGALAGSAFFQGWPSIFYVTGACGILWSIFWAILAFDSPDTHPRIRDDEKKYLIDSIGKQECKVKTPPVPWKNIVRSPQVWSLIFAHFSLDWGFRNLSMNLPSFMYQVLGVDISKKYGSTKSKRITRTEELKRNYVFNLTWLPLSFSNSLLIALIVLRLHEELLKDNGSQNSTLSAIPFMAVCLFIGASEKIHELVRRRKCMSPLAFKRILVFFAQIVPALFLVAVGHAGCDYVVPVFILTMASGFGGLSTPSILVNFAEIAPRFAGVLFGMSNTISIMSGQLAPVLVGYITADVANLRHAWQVVFYVGAAISALGGIVFMITVKVEVLPWAKLTAYRNDETNSDNLVITGKDWADDEKRALQHESNC